MIYEYVVEKDSFSVDEARCLFGRDGLGILSCIFPSRDVRVTYCCAPSASHFRYFSTESSVMFDRMIALSSANYLGMREVRDAIVGGGFVSRDSYRMFSAGELEDSLWVFTKASLSASPYLSEMLKTYGKNSFCERQRAVSDAEPESAAGFIIDLILALTYGDDGCAASMLRSDRIKKISATDLVGYERSILGIYGFPAEASPQMIACHVEFLEFLQRMEWPGLEFTITVALRSMAAPPPVGMPWAFEQFPKQGDAGPACFYDSLSHVRELLRARYPILTMTPEDFV